MVPINKREDVFRSNGRWTAEWINVYDPTDPVGTWLKDYDPEPTPPARHGYTKLTPQNFPCRASPFLLVSHIDYLNAPKPRFGKMPPDRDYYLINQIAHWLVRVDNLTARLQTAAKNSRSFWMPRAADQKRTRQHCFRRVLWTFVQEILVGLLLTVITVLSLNWLIFPMLKGASKAPVSFVSWFYSPITNYATALFPSPQSAKCPGRNRRALACRFICCCLRERLSPAPVERRTQ